MAKTFREWNVEQAWLLLPPSVLDFGTKVRGNASKHSDELWADARGRGPAQA